MALFLSQLTHLVGKNQRLGKVLELERPPQLRHSLHIDLLPLGDLPLQLRRFLLRHLGRIRPAGFAALFAQFAHGRSPLNNPDSSA